MTRLISKRCSQQSLLAQFRSLKAIKIKIKRRNHLYKDQSQDMLKFRKVQEIKRSRL